MERSLSEAQNEGPALGNPRRGAARVSTPSTPFVMCGSNLSLEKKQHETCSDSFFNVRDHHAAMVRRDGRRAAIAVASSGELTGVSFFSLLNHQHQRSL